MATKVRPVVLGQSVMGGRFRAPTLSVTRRNPQALSNVAQTSVCLPLRSVCSAFSALWAVCSFSKSTLYPTAALRFHAVKWINGTQGLLGHFRRAGIDSRLNLAHYVGASCHHSHRRLKLVGGLPQRLVLSLVSQPFSVGPDLVADCD